MALTYEQIQNIVDRWNRVDGSGPATSADMLAVAIVDGANAMLDAAMVVAPERASSLSLLRFELE